MDNNKFIKFISQNIPYYLWALFVFSTVTLIFDVYVAIIEYALTVLLTVIYKLNSHSKKTALSDYINSDKFAKVYSKEPIGNLPLPVVIISPEGKIIWNNKAFSDLVDANIVYEVNIVDYVPSFNIEKLNFNDDHIDMIVCHNDKIYNVFGNIVVSNSEKNSSSYIITYWDNITEFESLSQKYNDEQFVSSVIVIDNYEDLMQNTPNPDKPKLTATIEEELENLAQDLKGILKKYEKDRFFLYFQKKYLVKLNNEKFRILDDIKEINVGNKISPTLSIGVGVGSSDMNVNDAYSYSALDMALGRGGDQAAIKDGENCHFYGGKSTGVEKRSRVKSRVVANALKELVLNSDKILIMGHKRADLDVLGSALGLYRAIKCLGKDSYIVIGKENQTVEKFLNNIYSKYNNVFINKNTAVEIADKSSLVIVVDTHKISLVEQPALLDITKNIVVFDHHRKSTDFIQNPILTYHEPYSSSASELVTEVIQYMDENIKLEKSEAEALYAGIYLDTKGFDFKTGVRTFEAAAFLRRNDVDTIRIKKLFQIDIGTFMSKCNIIENVRQLRKSIAIATCSKTEGSDMQIVVASATDELLNISEITTAFVLCDMGGGNIIISARSLGETNVQVIMEKLGGGGHMTIAGTQMSDCTLEEAETLLINAIDENI